ncbi:MAG TPA: hypothetical protein VFX18_06250 [Candidatus Nitrosocosmicus sp.]|nr:hypothetical protein [Candidatus Nitrosocosmicus sp.]
MSEEEIKKQRYKDLIDSYFVEDPTLSKYSFKNIMSNTISSVVQRFFSIIVYYFDKYDQNYFHERMNNKYILIDKKTGERFECVGFDFVGDFRKFHKNKFITSLMAIRMNKTWFKFDEKKMAKIMIGLLQAKGWDIYEHEKECINQTIRRMKNIIYHSRDTLRELD